MEELRSTEVLDREILEDARKKAQRIHKTADDTLASQNQDWDKKIQRSLDSIRKTYEEREKKTKREILARFPLDQRRLRSGTAEGILIKTMEEFLKSLGRDKHLAILERELYARLRASPEDTSIGNGKEAGRELLYSGLSLSEAQGSLKKIFSDPSVKAKWPTGSDEEWDFTEDPNVSEFPSIVIKTGMQKITASVEGAANSLMKEKRGELACALLGEGVLND